MMLKVAGWQCDVEWENPAANLRALSGAAQRAAAAGVRLLALPEMFATGFSMQAARLAEWAAEIKDGVSQIARRCELHVLAGIVDAGERLPRNACVLFGPDGEMRGRYDKIHPFSPAREHEHYEGGEALPTFDVDGAHVTALVCYDLRFPEVFRAAAQDTELFVVIASWPEPRRHAWRSLLVARAIENQAYVLGVNRVGSGDGLDYAGDTVLIDPLGETLASAARQPQLVIGDVDPERARELRTKLPFLADVRPEVYARMRAPGARRAN
jgi:predicted amidohydrolase